MADIKLCGVFFTYGAGTPYKTDALRDVNITFEEGLVTALIGHTGSGKSTLVQMLNGLLKPDAGKVMLGDRDIWAEPKKMREIRFRVGLVMQYPEYQLFDETVRSDIAFGPKNMGLSAEEINERVEEAASFADFDAELLSKSPFELSGGQKRRAAIAGVIAMRPEILVLDEPAAGLDPAGRRSILSGIRAYCKKSGATVIIVSHNMEDIAVYCDKIAVMSGGSILMYGTREEIFPRWRELEDVGLGVPMITRIAQQLRERGVPIGNDIYTVEQALEAISACLPEDIRMAERH